MQTHKCMKLCTHFRHTKVKCVALHTSTQRNKNFPKQTLCVGLLTEGEKNQRRTWYWLLWQICKILMPTQLKKKCTQARIALKTPRSGTFFGGNFFQLIENEIYCILVSFPKIFSVWDWQYRVSCFLLFLFYQLSQIIKWLDSYDPIAIAMRKI